MFAKSMIAAALAGAFSDEFIPNIFVRTSDTLAARRKRNKNRAKRAKLAKRLRSMGFQNAVRGALIPGTCLKVFGYVMPCGKPGCRPLSRFHPDHHAQRFGAQSIETQQRDRAVWLSFCRTRLGRWVLGWAGYYRS